MIMSLSETSESAPLQLNKDVHISEMATTAVNSTKSEVASLNACNHYNPLLEDRLKPPDTTTNSGIVNGSLRKGNMCYEFVNGFASNQDTSDENCRNKCDSEMNDKMSAGQISLDATSNLSTVKPHTLSEMSVIKKECDGADLIANSNVSNDEKCIDELTTHLGSSSLIENSPIMEEDVIDGITYVVYESEKQMPDIMRLITKDLSEPYSIYTYRYFIHNWPKLCFLTMDKDVCVGAIVCKLDLHKKMVRRGYIAMLAVDSGYRRRKIGSTLVTKAIQAMIRDDCDEVVLETEITNQAALRLYENLGFVRDKRLFRYYLNGVDALRLKLWLR